MDVSAASPITTAVQGLKKADQQLNQAAQNIAGGSLDPQDVVSLSEASTGFKANSAVIRTADQMSQSLLDITA
jgi:flagellar hook protein FlgE